MNTTKREKELEKSTEAIEKSNGNVPVWVEAEKMFERMAELTKDTAHKAFEFFLHRGGELGRELEDWFRAENELLRPVSVEMKETDANIFVTAAVPGFKPEEIEVSVKDNVLIMSGNSECREEKDDQNLILREWKSNRFCRQLTLPSAVQAGKVEARLTDGMLELTLPKAAEQDAPRIAVAAG